MKKTLLLKTMLLLCALIVGSTRVWATVPDDPKWVATSLADISDGATIIIISNSTTATNIALPSTTTSSNPAKIACTVSTSDGITTITPPNGTTIQNLAWTLKKTTTNNTTTYQFFQEGSSNVRLYLTGTSSNTALRVGNASSSNDQFVLGSEGKLLKVTTATRYVGPYDNNGTDWRTYNSETATNYKGAVLTFYVLQEAPEFEISAQSNDESYGTVSLSGSVITGAPKAGYRYADPAYTVSPANSATVSQEGDEFTVTPSANTTVTINFEAIPTHTVTWSVNGAETSEDVAEGVTITFPANPVDLAGKNFVGWTKTSIVGETDVKPSLVTSEVMGTEDVAFYAVYATVIGTPATLTKMASDETLSDGDKIVIVANDGTTEYGLYQKESKSKYIDKYVFDGQVETVAADDLNWVTANAEEGGLWSFGDATNGYIYNSSGNEFKIVTDNKTSFTVAYNSDNNGFTIKNGSRWFAYRADLTEANRLFRGAGESTTPTDGSVAYFDIYKYVAGNASYSGYCTSITVSATISDAGYATFSNASAVDFSSNTGLSVYYVSSTTGNKAEMVEISSKKVPASTGVLLKGAAGNYSGAVTTGVDALVGNLLFACVDGYDATVDNEIYILANGGSGVGFYPIKGGTSLGAGKAYIGGGDVNAKCLTLSFGSETTAINGVEEVAPANVKTRKVVKNGRLVIETANGEFTIDGARVK